MGWRDAPIVAGNAAANQTAKWASAPEYKTSDDVYAAEAKKKEQENREAGALTRFGRGAKAQMGRFALGALELADNIAEPFSGNHLIDRETLALAQQGADVIDKGTGVAGFAGNVAGDPLTWALGGVGGAGIKGAKTTGQAIKAGSKAGAITGGISGLMQGTGDADSTVVDNLTNAAIGAGVGAGAGAVIPAATSGAKSLKNTVVPKITNEETARLAKIAMDENIPLRGSQIGNSRFSKTVASATKSIPFSGAKGFSDDQILAFNKAVLKKAGIDADAATPEVMSAAKQNFNKIYKNLTDKTKITVGDDLLNDIAVVESEASKRLGKDATQTLSSYIDDVLGSGGEISGEIYQNTRSRLGELAKSSKDPLLSRAYKSLQKSLDDAAFESLDDAGKQAWLDTRKQYGAYKTIMNALNSTSEEAAIGNITPGRLAMAVKSRNPEYAAGAGELNELSRVGSAFLKDAVPNSGTPERLAAYGTLFGAPGALAGGVSGAAIAPVAGVGTARLFNAVDTAQPLIKRAIKKGVQQETPGVINRAIPAIGVAAGRASEMGDERNDAPAVAPVNLKDVPVEKPQSWRNAPTDNADQRLAMAESGGDPNAKNPNSSASGLYQFTDPTWNSLVNKYGRKYGITKAHKNDPQAQNIMLQHLKADNARQLKAKGLPVNDETLYFAHFMGAPAASKAMKMLGKNAIAARSFPSAAKANRSVFYDKKGKPRTIDEVYQLITSKVA